MRCTAHTVRNLHFLAKNSNFDSPRKIVELFWVKTRENAAVWDFLAVDNFDFTRIEFLDKKLTFRIVCKSKLITKLLTLFLLWRSQQQLLDSTMTSTTSKSSITAVKTTTTIAEEPEPEAKTNGESEGILIKPKSFNILVYST